MSNREGRILSALLLAGGLIVGSAAPATTATIPTRPVVPVERIGELKGYAAINELIQHRLLRRGDERTSSFQMSALLGAAGTDALIGMLGVEVSDGGTTRFQNVTPNGLSMLLWRVALEAFVERLVGVCEAPDGDLGAFALDPGVAGKLAALCSWHGRESVPARDLEAVWQAIAGFDAPYEEAAAWRAYFTDASSPYDQSDAPTTMKAMVLAIFLSPYVMLRN